MVVEGGAYTAAMIAPLSDSTQGVGYISERVENFV